MQELLDRAAELIRSARHVVALTGAGISTPSGIPDFRSPGSGLWEKYDPYAVASLDAFMRDPRAYYAWRKPLMDKLAVASPNSAHCALAALEQRNLLRAVITQNIDGLHQRAGSRRVLEVHGTARELLCTACGQVYPESPEIWHRLDRGELPDCWLCGGILKPNVVLFGEMLPHAVMREVMRELHACDLILVVGSSLEVHPACLWPDEVIQRGAQAIIVNYTETYLDSRAAVAFHADVAQVLPALAQALETKP